MALLSLLLFASQASGASSLSFFKIESITSRDQPGKDGLGVWKAVGDPMHPKNAWQPSIEVKLGVQEDTRSEKITAKAYFFDEGDKLAATSPTPSNIGVNAVGRFAVPVLFYKDKPNSVFFAVPPSLSGKHWTALIIWGDKDEKKASCYPVTRNYYEFDFPEKKQVMDTRAKSVERKPDMDPLIEHVVRTGNPKMPQITLFLRPPKGVNNAAEVQGVMAICLLANSLEDMKRELRKEEMSGDYGGLLGFANKHKLAILAWGSKRLWDPTKNYDDLTREELREMDKSLDIVADSWERGVEELSAKYGIPDRNFILWGNCGSAQWAARLCLRKPDRFLAIHVHMPGSYDRPPIEGSKVLWCLTIGELEGGYERSKRFVAACRELGYPMVYKAIVGLGHAGHPDAAALGFSFLEYSLTLKEAREAYDKDLAAGKIPKPEEGKNPQPWPESFRNPPFYGDIVNQELFPAKDVAMIPAGFRVPIPTPEMAKIWARSK